ncbi:MAG: hypothetical protein K6G00_09080 [Treponema sp.]|nr:hypothetical protein [Treponema sp.]
MSHKLLKASFLTFFLIIAGIVMYVMFISMSISGTVLGMNGENFIALNAQSARARVTHPSKNSSLYYQFTTNQRTHLMNRINKNNGAAIQATLRILGKHANLKKEVPYEFGFLYDKDGEAVIGTGLVKGDFSDLVKEGKSAVSLSMCISDSKNLPIGFFVHGMLPYELSEIRIVDMKIGWDKSTDVNLYAFGIHGGNVSDISGKELDVRDGAVLFAPSEKKLPLPKVLVGLKPAQTIGTLENQKTLNFYYGNEKLSVRRSYSQNSVTLQLSGFRAGYDVLEFAEPSEILSAMLVGNDKKLNADKNGNVYYPLVTDLGMIVHWPEQKWRTADYELFEWEEIPHVLFFDFANYDIQNDFLTRLAYFAEKAGYKGTLVSDEFVATHHGYNAHDYKAKDLAAFFTVAALNNFRLKGRELLLRDILVKNGVIIAEQDGTYSEGTGAVISFSRQSPENLRWQFLAHESWHGIFFTNESFRHKVSIIYNSFDDKSLEFIKTFWETQSGLNYDRTDEYLMRNELMAYIMQQRYSYIGEYFVSLAKRWSVNQNEPELAEYIRNTQASAFVEAGKELNEYAFNNFGLAAGRVHLIGRSYRD